jgi:hypothetical protein
MKREKKPFPTARKVERYRQRRRPGSNRLTAGPMMIGSPLSRSVYSQPAEREGRDLAARSAIRG